MLEYKWPGNSCSIPGKKRSAVRYGNDSTSLLLLSLSLSSYCPCFSALGSNTTAANDSFSSESIGYHPNGPSWWKCWYGYYPTKLYEATSRTLADSGTLLWRNVLLTSISEILEIVITHAFLAIWVVLVGKSGLATLCQLNLETFYCVIKSYLSFCFNEQNLTFWSSI